MAENSIDLGSYPGKDSGSFTPGDTSMILQFTSGATGAVPATLTKRNGFGKGAASAAVERDDVGEYTAHLARRWAEFAGGFGNVLTNAAYDPDVAVEIRVTGVDLTEKTVTFVVVDSAGDPIDPAAGDVVLLRLWFNRYTLNVAK